MGIAGHADGEQTGAKGLLAQDERCPSGGTALLPVGIGEYRSFLGDSINIWRAIPHQAHCVGANLRNADVVAEDDKDVGLLSLLRAEFSTREDESSGKCRCEDEFHTRKATGWAKRFLCFHGLRTK